MVGGAHHITNDCCLNSCISQASADTSIAPTRLEAQQGGGLSIRRLAWRYVRLPGHAGPPISHLASADPHTSQGRDLYDHACDQRACPEMCGVFQLHAGPGPPWHQNALLDC